MRSSRRYQAHEVRRSTVEWGRIAAVVTDTVVLLLLMAAIYVLVLVVGSSLT